MFKYKNLEPLQKDPHSVVLKFQSEQLESCDLMEPLQPNNLK